MEPTASKCLIIRIDISSAPSWVSPRRLLKTLSTNVRRGRGQHTKQCTHLHSYTINYRPYTINYRPTVQTLAQSQQQTHKLHVCNKCLPYSQIPECLPYSQISKCLPYSQVSKCLPYIQISQAFAIQSPKCLPYSQISQVFAIQSSLQMFAIQSDLQVFASQNPKVIGLGGKGG